MKIVLTIGVIQAIGFTALGQDIAEKANPIVVEAGLMEAARILEQEGYVVQEPNVQLGHLSTEVKSVKAEGGGTILMQVTAFAKGDLLKLTASFKPDPNSAVKRAEACACGPQGSMARRSFGELVRLAKILSAEEPVYAVQ